MIYRWKAIENTQLSRAGHFFTFVTVQDIFLNTQKLVFNGIHETFKPFIRTEHIIYRWKAYEYDQLFHLDSCHKFVAVCEQF